MTHYKRQRPMHLLQQCDVEVKTPTAPLAHILAKPKARHFPTHWAT